MLAPHVAAMSAVEPLLHHQPVGMLFVAGAAADQWNAQARLQNAPLAGLSSEALEKISGHISTSYVTNAAKSLARPWLVVDASMPTYALEATEDAEDEAEEQIAGIEHEKREEKKEGEEDAEEVEEITEESSQSSDDEDAGQSSEENQIEQSEESLDDILEMYYDWLHNDEAKQQTKPGERSKPWQIMQAYARLKKRQEDQREKGWAKGLSQGPGLD